MALSKDYVNGMIKLYKKAYSGDTKLSEKINKAIEEAIQLNLDYIYEDKLYTYLKPEYKKKVEKNYINCTIDELEQNSSLNKKELIALKNKISKHPITLTPEELLEIYESFWPDNKYRPVWIADTNIS